MSLAALLVVTGVLLVRWVESGPTPPHLNGAVFAAVERDSPKPAGLLRLAGSGSNLPLTRALAEAFTARRPWVRVRVHESIGSSGGIRAAADGAIDIGLVSRSLKDEERELGLTEVPYARVAVVFAGNANVPVGGLDREQVLDLYSGRQTHWSDGSPVVVLQREIDDSSHIAAHTGIPGFDAVDEEAWDAGRWRVLFHDRAMQEALVATPGAIGLFDQGLATIQALPLRILAFDGRLPTEASLLDASYPLHKDLGFVLTRDGADTLAIAFLEFVFSDDGRRIIRDSGYVPHEPARSALFDDFVDRPRPTPPLELAPDEPPSGGRP